MLVWDCGFSLVRSTTWLEITVTSFLEINGGLMETRLVSWMVSLV